MCIAGFSFLLELEENANLPLAELNFSPDGRYFLAGTLNTDFAYDLEGKHEARLPASIRNLMRGEFTFVDPERVLGLNSSNPAKSPMLKFPGGERLGEFQLAYDLKLAPTAHG